MEHAWRRLTEQIALSGSTEHLRRLRNDFHVSAGALLLSKAPEALTEQINDVHDALIARAVELAEEAAGEPAASYAILLLGSGGRREQMLSSDQDHCIVYEPLPGNGDEQASRYALHLGEQIRIHLEQIGYPPCDGDVLGSNSLWRKDISGWEAALSEWAVARDFESVRRLLIAADARVIHGDEALSGRFLAAYSAELEKGKGSLLPRMLENTLRHKVLIGLFGNLLTERYGVDSGGIDIKYGAYIPMVNGIRLLSLAEGIHTPSTAERIRRLSQCGAISSARAKEWEEAFECILTLRSMIPTQEEQERYTNRGKLPPGLLTKEVKTRLKQALRVGAELQAYVKRTFASEGLL